MFSLITATLGRVEELDRLLTSLDSQTCRQFEVLIVDQNPDERLAPLLQSHPALAIRHLRSARGLSRARNAALPAAEGDIIAFPDDDCWYPPQLLENVKRWFDDHPEFGALFASLRDADGSAVAVKWPTRSCRLTRENIFRYGISPNAFLRRSVTDVIGTFNENIGVGASTPFQSGEDLDYFLRPLARGVQMRFEPSLTVHHPSFHDPERLRRTTYGYAMGGAYVLRTRGYPLRFFLWCLTKSLGGALVSLLKLNVENSRIYLLRASGQIRGYFWGPAEMARVRSKSS